MISRLSQAFLLITVMMMAAPALCDHALLTDGRVVYNVMVPDNATTGGELVRIRTTAMSFGFDPRTNTVFSLPSHSVIEHLADYVTTSTTVGRAKATALVQHRKWDRYIPVRITPPLIAPTPAPKATPVPVYAAQSTPIPLNVVSDSLPLEERLDKQLDLFMKEQTRLAQDATTSMVRGLINSNDAKTHKVQLLQKQKMILEQYYPQTTETVRLAVDYWGEQVGRAQQTGRFDLENL